jgi:hypothetical protein
MSFKDMEDFRLSIAVSQRCITTILVFLGVPDKKDGMICPCHRCTAVRAMEQTLFWFNKGIQEMEFLDEDRALRGLF